MENLTQLYSLFIDLTYACNISCRTCLCPQIDKASGGQLLPLETAQLTIEEFAKMGGKFVGIYGGEPLLVKYVYEVVKTAADKGLSVTLTTNGMAATEKNSRQLLANGLSGATVSIDGDKIGHEMIRGKDTFNKAIKGAENLVVAARELRKNDFKLDLHLTICRANIRSFAGLIDEAARIGPEVFITVALFSRMNPDITKQMEQLLKLSSNERLNHWCLPKDLLLTHDDILPLRDILAEMKIYASERGVVLHLDPALDEYFDEQHLLSGTFNLKKNCSVFEDSVIVGPDARIGSCPMLTHFSFGQIDKKSLAEIWNSPIYQDLREKMKNNYLPVCQHCCNHSNLM
jgi:MoaA/NifB/PqqE/SkfB family radical SAM enzyme